MRDPGCRDCQSLTSGDCGMHGPFQGAPSPMAITKVFYCTNISHDFPVMGHGQTCACGRQRLVWQPNADGAHVYMIEETQ